MENIHHKLSSLIGRFKHNYGTSIYYTLILQYSTSCERSICSHIECSDVLMCSFVNFRNMAELPLNIFYLGKISNI